MKPTSRLRRTRTHKLMISKQLRGDQEVNTKAEAEANASPEIQPTRRRSKKLGKEGIRWVKDEARRLAKHPRGTAQKKTQERRVRRNMPCSNRLCTEFWDDLQPAGATYIQYLIRYIPLCCAAVHCNTCITWLRIALCYVTISCTTFTSHFN